MKRHCFFAIFALILMAGPAGHGQAPDAAIDKELLALIKQVQAQQTQIADNQAKIDAKLADVAETLRVARIFTARGK
jgi:hypothetical protein